MSLTPKNWASFQHYKDRAPVWIKLHRSLLDDFAFSRLPDASKALAPLLWLLASEYERGKITATFEEVAFRLRMTEGKLRDAIKPLIDGEFFASDSDPLAKREPDACLEKRREETEKKDCPAEGRTLVDDFVERFWKPYPRTPNMSRKEALGVWQRLSPVDRDAAVAALPRYVAFLRGKPDHPTVHACRFLSQRRFEGFNEESARAANVPAFEAVPTADGSGEWIAWWQHHADARNKFSLSEMKKARDFGKPYLAPSRWPPGHANAEGGQNAEASAVH